MAFPFELPEVGYDYDALEPHIDARTMQIHHSKHHQGYTNKLNAALEGQPSFHSYSAEQLLRGIQSLPESVRTAVRNNGGGFFNHRLFWDVMRPGGSSAPSGALATTIDGAFGSVEGLKQKLNAAAGGQFGSGWGLALRFGFWRSRGLRHRQPGQPVDDRSHADPRCRRLGARLLPALPEPAPRLSGCLVECRELGLRRFALRRRGGAGGRRRFEVSGRRC